MERGARKRDKWIPWYFVAFFVVLAILDGIFVTIALSTHTGLITENAYQKGLDYNDSIAASETQNKLGWQSKITFNNEVLSFALHDKDANAIENAKVIAYFVRITQDGYDFLMPLTYIENGQYRQKVKLPLKGQWDVRIAVIWNKQQYQQSKRIIVK